MLFYVLYISWHRHRTYSLSLYMGIYIDICIYIYIFVYIERDRDRELVIYYDIHVNIKVPWLKGRVLQGFGCFSRDILLAKATIGGVNSQGNIITIQGPLIPIGCIDTYELFQMINLFI